MAKDLLELSDFELLKKAGLTDEDIDKTLESLNEEGYDEDAVVRYMHDQAMEAYNYLTSPEKQRGRNLGGYTRAYIADTFKLGRGIDEAEATVRSGLAKALDKIAGTTKQPTLRDYLNASPDTPLEDVKPSTSYYEDYLKNARDSRMGFRENSAVGDIMRVVQPMIGDSVRAIATRGATLVPTVSGILGSASGALTGEGEEGWTDSRLKNATIEGAIDTVIPSIMNKIFIGKTGLNVSPIRALKEGSAALAPKAEEIEPVYKAIVEHVKEGGNPNEALGRQIGYHTQKVDKQSITKNLKSNKKALDYFREPALNQPMWRERVGNVIEEVAENAPAADKSVLLKAKDAIINTVKETPDDIVNEFDDIITTSFNNKTVVEEINEALSGLNLGKNTNERLINALDRLKGVRRAEKIPLGINPQAVGAKNAGQKVSLFGINLPFLKLNSVAQGTNKLTNKGVRWAMQGVLPGTPLPVPMTAANSLASRLVNGISKE